MMKKFQKWLLGAAIVALGTLAAAGSNAAPEAVCVSCEGPSRIYSCSMAPRPDGNVPSLGTRSLQFTCMQDIAQRYQHATCSVKQNQIGVCAGDVHMVTIPPREATPTAEAAAPADAAAPAKASAPADDPVAGKGKVPATGPVTPSDAADDEPDRKSRSETGNEAEPKTMIELAKRTAKSTKEEIENSADKVSKAARSTWDCVTSLFTDC